MGIVGIVYFGGQYNHLIKRRVEELGFKAIIVEPTLPLSSLNNLDCLIIGGGSWNIPEDLEKLGRAPEYVLDFPGPLLGICLGHQLIAYTHGGSLGRNPEFGGVRIYVDDEDTILRGLREFTAWESHNIEVSREPRNFQVIAHSDKVRVQAMRHVTRPLFGVQFHPEVRHTEEGINILRNFLSLCTR